MTRRSVSQVLVGQSHLTCFSVWCGLSVMPLHAGEVSSWCLYPSGHCLLVLIPLWIGYHQFPIFDAHGICFTMCCGDPCLLGWAHHYLFFTLVAKIKAKKRIPMIIIFSPSVWKWVQGYPRDVAMPSSLDSCNQLAIRISKCMRVSQGWAYYDPRLLHISTMSFQDVE